LSIEEKQRKALIMFVIHCKKQRYSSSVGKS
jgi:hypothetical protein